MAKPNPLLVWAGLGLLPGSVRRTRRRASSALRRGWENAQDELGHDVKFGVGTLFLFTLFAYFLGNVPWEQSLSYALMALATAFAIRYVWHVIKVWRNPSDNPTWVARADVTGATSLVEIVFDIQRKDGIAHPAPNLRCEVTFPSGEIWLKEYLNTIPTAPYLVMATGILFHYRYGPGWPDWPEGPYPTSGRYEYRWEERNEKGKWREILSDEVDLTVPAIPGVVMRVIIEEIERALAGGLYYLAIMAALQLPDICAALESPDGETTRTKYKAWYDAWLAATYTRLTAEDCYSLRCGVLHQGRFGHSKMQYARVIFTLPNAHGGVFHGNILNDALNLDAVTFCKDMIAAVSRWYAAKQNDPNVVANLPRLVLFREKGLAPYIGGTPVIA